jgi:hypothetical protein
MELEHLKLIRLMLATPGFKIPLELVHTASAALQALDAEILTASEREAITAGDGTRLAAALGDLKSQLLHAR